MYLSIKYIHVILVAISVTLFQYRYWRFRYFDQQPGRTLKILPHIIDTLLLISGVYLAWLAGFSPLNSDWLLYKLIALLIYILAGTLAMKKVGIVRWSAYAVSVLAVLYILIAANIKHPWPFQ